MSNDSKETAEEERRVLILLSNLRISLRNLEEALQEKVRVRNSGYVYATVQDNRPLIKVPHLKKAVLELLDDHIKTCKVDLAQAIERYKEG